MEVDPIQQEAIAEEDRITNLEAIDRAIRGSLELEARDTLDVITTVLNLHISRCFACGKLAVWVADKLVFPQVREAELPNSDLPEDIKQDYDEASRIVSLSPRGAAALLRLAIQKLCAFLGEKESNIDQAIASLVKKGLLPQVQQSLDVLRVIGNEAVHPGTMDLRDDIETAQQLFKLVNLIATQMISHPAQVQRVFDKLPSSKRVAIEKRDAKR